MNNETEMKNVTEIKNGARGVVGCWLLQLFVYCNNDLLIYCYT